MAHWLTNIRKKPKHVRDNIAFGVAGAFTCVLCAVWFLGGKAAVSLTETATDSPRFFETFLGQFGKQVATVKESLPEKQEVPKQAPATAVPFPESGPATTSPSISASTTASLATSARQIMIVTTSSTPATTSTTDL